ncbi:hypothetical protein [Rufibacter ruber]|uniref:hypothetical protein n=1 Tax=Rufibacter ruber TaxID=1783499 RepID=UPI0012906D10|nr:hypothetical protein [Rufibacter ruber]
MYSLELLQAINDWQATGIGNNKTQIAEEILAHSQSLPNKFKSLTSKCYRRVALNGMNSVLLGANMQLPETYSSWSFDKSVAQNFNGGVPHKGYQGVIFELDNKDTGYSVILNLSELFNDSDFIEACERNQKNIKSYKSGIGYFMNSEAEVILKVDNLTTKQIWAYGGYSNSREKLAEMFFGHKPNSQELIFFDEAVKNANVKIGGNWVTGAAKDRIVKLHIETAQRLTKKK